ncbi:hypothetical protein ASD56_05710 [Microbacterium sp. Root166]|uniref:DUF4192 domain-containing protein n=1 Tax=Microbacterium sp. Root166 TaxID=1736478 RepID=UPI0006F25774|nr:DUF4192 domain-containing protein [Microbacterium sp. Root166]KQZ85781.1 hypothetical protein ASD56_05710 [Microbacterium sp. Root166]
MTTIVKAAGAAEFLSLVPHLLGYVPSQSLVLIPFDGSRSLGAMRFDLPSAEADTLDAGASTVLGIVCRVQQADAVAAIAYTDAGFADGGGMPHRDLFDALRRRADACGLGVTDVLCVARDGWGSLFDPDCPDDGRPLSELESAAAADLPVPALDRDQASGADLPSIDLATRERTARALIALERAVALLCGGDPEDAGAAASVVDEPDRVDPQVLATVCALDDLPTLYEEALSWPVDELDPYDVAAIAWCLARPSLRDVALVQWSGTVGDGDEAFDAQLRWEAGEEYPAHLAMQMWGEGDRPDPGRLERALELARHVAAASPRAVRPGALAMCAWISWALGRSTHAEVYACLACEIEPDHGLSEIVRSFVHAGHLPDWAFTRTPRSKPRRRTT